MASVDGSPRGHHTTREGPSTISGGLALPHSLWETWGDPVQTRASSPLMSRTEAGIPSPPRTQLDFSRPLHPSASEPSPVPYSRLASRIPHFSFLPS